VRDLSCDRDDVPRTPVQAKRKEQPTKIVIGRRSEVPWGTVTVNEFSVNGQHLGRPRPAKHQLGD